jgi:nitroreductase
MDAFEAVRTLLAVRNYQDKAVPEDSLRRILEAGRLTGSSMNGQPWHFLVIQNRDTLRQLGSLLHTGPYVAQAPLAIVVVIEHTTYAISDASRAIQSMLLTAWTDGLGSNWVGFGGLDNIKALLGIPAEVEVFAVLPIGYPRDEIKGQGKKRRKALSEVAYREQWGQPFAWN